MARAVTASALPVAQSPAQFSKDCRSRVCFPPCCLTSFTPLCTQLSLGTHSCHLITGLRAEAVCSDSWPGSAARLEQGLGWHRLCPFLSTFKARLAFSSSWCSFSFCSVPRDFTRIANANPSAELPAPSSSALCASPTPGCSVAPGTADLLCWIRWQQGTLSDQQNRGSSQRNEWLRF